MCGQQVEVERLVVLVGTKVQRAPFGRHPRFRDHHAILVLVEHPAPTTHDGVQIVAIEVRDRFGGRLAVVDGQSGIGVAGRLGQRVCHVDPEPGGAAIEPEPHHRFELVGDVGMVPVHVRLAVVEEVQVPLAVGDPRPCRPPEDGLPVVRWQLAARAPTVEEVVAGASVGARRRRQSLDEPDVFGRGVVRDEVDEHPDPVLGCLGDERLGVGGRAELIVDLAIVGNVVATVVQRRAVPGVDPHRVDAELSEIPETRPHPGDVTGAVAIAVRERPHVDLVDDGMPPPLRVGLAWHERTPRSVDGPATGARRLGTTL